MKTEPNATIIRQTTEGGLTKREHFAAMMMQGLASNPNYTSFALFKHDHARKSVEFADELIEALNKQKK